MQTTNEQDAWGECPSGELQNLAKRLQDAERRRQNMSLARVAAGTMASTAGLVLAIGLLFGGGNDSLIAGIKCADCKANFVAYNAYLTEGEAFSQELAGQMASHLKECNWCRGSFENKYPGTLEEHNVLAVDLWRLPNNTILDLSRSEASFGYAVAH